MLGSLVTFPILFWLQFSDPDIRTGGHWHGGGVSVGWSLYVGVAGIVLLAAATGLLAVNKFGEEVIYREKIIRASEDPGVEA
ncbi:unnamed protein product [Protopolystoma xenopodis]|uniref:Uncharacterized protein n=1 Tax=Protopolystoma xenopodis TaxID=117903 RepID=A0A3S4ZN09_9PLAT|nr:unnamed protein product [Protopolystoma xenopodis]